VLDEPLRQQIRAKIRSGASPRHVPAKIVAVADIPRTKSGKITELAVRDVVHGREIKNQEALANPRRWSCSATCRNSEPDERLTADPPYSRAVAGMR
jgi:hypothetical protein